MTLKEAIESGKKFKRKLHGTFMVQEDDKIVFYVAGQKYVHIITTEDAIATDWKIEKIPKIYTIDVTWQKLLAMDGEFYIVPIGNVEDEYVGNLILGKETKLTIEVLD